MIWEVDVRLRGFNLRLIVGVGEGVLEFGLFVSADITGAREAVGELCVRAERLADIPQLVVLRHLLLGHVYVVVITVDYGDYRLVRWV